MATIKSYTSLEQSRKLAEILPLESADMYWMNGKLDKVKQHPTPNIIGNDHDEPLWDGFDVPCWSLAALLDVLPFPVLYMEMLGGAILWCCERHFMETEEVVKIEHYDNPVDACYEMIIKLNELKML